MAVESVRKVLNGRWSAISFVFNHPAPTVFWILMAIAVLVVGVWWATSPPLQHKLIEEMFGTRTVTQLPPTSQPPKPVPVPEVIVPPVPRPAVRPPAIQVPTNAEVPAVAIVKPKHARYWITVEYGAKYENAQTAFSALKEEKVSVSPMAKEALARYISETIPKNSFAHVARVTVAELGFEGPQFPEDIIKQALKRKYKLLSIDAIPAIAMDYDESRKLFFATHITADQSWSAMLAVHKAMTENRDAGLSVFEPHEFVHGFDPDAIFLFALPN